MAQNTLENGSKMLHSVTLKHVTGNELVDKLRMQDLMPKARYTVILKEEENIHENVRGIVPDFYDDEANSEEEIQTILESRTTSQKNYL